MLFLLTGLVIGLFAGLALAWLIFPASLVDIAPERLGPRAKEEYRVMVSLAFASSGDVERAQARLALLRDANPVRQLNSQAQLALLDQNSQLEARALGQLAAALSESGQGDAGFDSHTAPTLLESAAYTLLERQLICSEEDGAASLRIFVLTGDETPALGLPLQLTAGEVTEERVTGSNPEGGASYAEFQISEGQVYQLTVAGQPVLKNIQIATCEEGGIGDWLVTLQAK